MTIGAPRLSATLSKVSAALTLPIPAQLGAQAGRCAHRGAQRLAQPHVEALTGVAIGIVHDMARQRG
jgi:hypothetical protein